jgi:hypothetical protein
LYRLVPAPDQQTVRTHLAHAYAATGEPQKALEIYRPVFDSQPNFVTFVETRRLATFVDIDQALAFVKDTIQRLQEKLPDTRYLLCQVYLLEGQFDEAYALVSGLTGYTGIEEAKLVAKAHVMAALGPTPAENFGPNLRDLYEKVAEGDKETNQFLQMIFSLPPGLSRQVAIGRAEAIYNRLVQTHIDNGRKTYATAAYYCALIGEIAAMDGRLPGFFHWYHGFMEQYKRHRALHSEMELKLGKLLQMR